MATLRIGYHYQKALRLLMSMKNPQVATLMRRRGFDEAELERGWTLFEEAAGRNLSFKKSAQLLASPSRELVEATDRWENIYFDVVDASLLHNFPRLHERVFLNLGKTSGPDVILSVGTLLKRLDDLEQEGGETIEAAFALMDKRGLTPAVRDEARALLARAQEMASTAEPTLDPADEARRQEAEQRMWDWYLEWAKLARTVVESKRLRIYMGVSQASRGDDAGDTEPLLDGPGTAALAPTPGQPAPSPALPSPA